MNEYTNILQPTVIIGVLGSMIKFLVVDKIKTQGEDIKECKRLISRQRSEFLRMHGFLTGKGCINGTECHLNVEEPIQEE